MTVNGTVDAVNGTVDTVNGTVDPVNGTVDPKRILLYNNFALGLYFVLHILNVDAHQLLIRWLS